MSRVIIDAQAFTDSRFAVLAYLMDWQDADTAIGKMARVWLECTLRETDTLKKADLCFAFGCAPDVPVAECLIESGLGEDAGDCVRIRGCKGRTEWVSKKQASKDAYTLADYLRKKLLEHKPDHRIGRGANADTKWTASSQRKRWAQEADRMHRIDGRGWRRSGELVSWLFGPNLDAEFSYVVESIKALRAKWDRIDLAERKTNQPQGGEVSLEGYVVYDATGKK